MAIGLDLSEANLFEVEVTALAKELAIIADFAEAEEAMMTRSQVVRSSGSL